MAAVTPLGDTAATLWSAIQADRQLCDRGVISDALFMTLRKQAQNHAAAMGFAYPAVPSLASAGSKGAAQAQNGPQQHSEFADRSIELGTMACMQALANAGWSADVCSRADTALFVATSKGPILRLLEACAMQRSGKSLPTDLAWHVALGPAALQTVLAGIINPGGPVQTHIAACAGSLIGVQRAWNAIRRGECKRAIVVASDASIHPLFEHSFENLGVFAKRDNIGRRYCRPFDPSGGGFFISEAAAAICLEAGDGENVEVENCWLGADATHLLAIDPTGASLERGLRACAAERKVTFIQAHAAGTQHDRVEWAAITRVCGREAAVFSHKHWLGHCLGASGLLGLVISAMCHQHATLPLGPAISRPARSITISQGFGGHIGMCVLAG